MSENMRHYIDKFREFFKKQNEKNLGDFLINNGIDCIQLPLLFYDFRKDKVFIHFDKTFFYIIREIVDNSQIRERLQRESSSEEALLHSEKVIELTKKFLGLGLINERYHKIENDKLIINQTNLYKVYSEYFKQKELDFLSKIDFYDAIRKSKEFVKNIKGTRFKNNNTSAIMIKI